MGELTRFILFMGPVSSIFDYTTFAMMWCFFHAHGSKRTPCCSRPAGLSNRC